MRSRFPLIILRRWVGFPHEPVVPQGPGAARLLAILSCSNFDLPLDYS